MDRKTRALALALICSAALIPHAAPGQVDSLGTGTFSILGYDPDTGELGAAVQSRVFSVGNGVLWAEANVGIASRAPLQSSQSVPRLRLAFDAVDVAHQRK